MLKDSVNENLNGDHSNESQAFLCYYSVILFVFQYFGDEVFNILFVVIALKGGSQCWS